MMWGITEIEGWFYSRKFNYYQRTKGRAAAYVMAYVGFYCIQVYERGNLGMCDIEHRKDTAEEAFLIAQEMLDAYHDKTKQDMWQHEFSPHNREGYWQNRYKN